jgi:hypothetical protein
MFGGRALGYMLGKHPMVMGSTRKLTAVALSSLRAIGVV